MTTPTTPYAKFGFDTEFFELVQGQQGGTTNTGVPASPATQAKMVEEARQSAYAEGYAKGLEEGQAQAQTDLAQLQQHLQNTLLALQSSQTEREEQLLVQMLSLLRVSVHQLLGHVAVYLGPELLEHHLRALLPLLVSDEALTLKIHPAARGFHEKLGLPQASIMGLPMNIVSDPAMGHTDAVVQWTNGGAESKLAKHLESFDALLAGVGAQMLSTEHKANLSPQAAAPIAAAPVPRAVPSAADRVPEVDAVSDEVPGILPDVEDEAQKAAKARADALLGDDDEMVDALK